MRILCDFHHEELLQSLWLLIEKRLGWKLYVPVGIDWFTKGYWKIHPARETAGQFLENNIFLHPENYKNESHTLYSPTFYRHYRATTLDSFLNTKFDLLIASEPNNYIAYKKLAQSLPNKPKVVFQVGNNWNLNGVDYVLSSATGARIKNYKELCYYNQEFPVNKFRYESGTSYSTNLTQRRTTSICSLLHFQTAPGQYILDKLKEVLPHWEIKTFGAGNKDGQPFSGYSEMAELFQYWGFLFHYKPQGDGYGYNLHHALAAGMPIITCSSFFKGMTVAPKLVEGKSLIDITSLSIPQLADKLVAAEADYSNRSQQTKDIFDYTTNFDLEFETKVKPFFERVLSS